MIILLLLTLCRAGHIYVWDSALSYDMQGRLDTITVPFKLESGALRDSYLHFSGILLHSTTMSEVSISLTLPDGTITTATASDSPPSTYASEYFFLLSVDLPRDTWMNLEIHASNGLPGQQPKPFGLRTVSSLSPLAIAYDENLQAGIINIATLPQSGMTIQFSIDAEKYPNYLLPGDVYEMNIDITPRVALTGVQLILKMSIEQHTEGLLPNDFVFLIPANGGACSSSPIPELGIEAFTDYVCIVDAETQQTITLATQEQLIANQKTRIVVNVRNPPYVSARDLRAISVAINDGNVIVERGIRTNMFVVQPIVVTTQAIKYLWGIDVLSTLSNTYVGLWAAEDPTKLQGPYNAVTIKFSVQQSAPPAYPQQVKIKLSCTYALAGSTSHNLQAFDDSAPIYCRYVTPYMVCYNVGNLAPQVTYFVSTKIYFAAPTQMPDFGVVDITISTPDPARPLQVYSPSIGIYQNVVRESHLLDIGGWHGANGELSYTQVSSISGNDLTHDSLQGAIGESATVGIVPGYRSPSSLLFFLKASSQQFCGPSALPADTCGSTNIGSKYLMMTIMLNSDVLTSDAQNAPQKLNYLAEDGGGTFASSNFPCFSAGYCDVEGQNTYSFVNADQSSSAYGIAKFECGLFVQPGNVVTNCNVFKGALTSQLGGSGVLALPSISWKKDFVHSTTYADETLLDFVVSFYQGDLTVLNGKPTSYSLVTSHLINAYTVESYRPDSIQTSFINYYMGTTKGNDGQYAPLLFRVKGTLTQTDLLVADRLAVFFDTSVSPAFFADDLAYSCSSDCIGVPNANPGALDNWQLQAGVDIAVSQTQFDVVFPVSILATALPTTIYVVLHKSVNSLQNVMREAPYRVFRMHGAAIQSPPSNGAINGLTAQAADLTLPYLMQGSMFDLAVRLSSISPSFATSALEISTSATDVTPQTNDAKLIGAGLSLVSVGDDIFSGSELHAYTTRHDCLPSFAIKRPQVGILTRYALFCPFDDVVRYPLSITNVAYTAWPKNYPLATSLSYSMSGNSGQLITARQDPGVVARLLKTCTLSRTSGIYPNSLGRQRVRLPIELVGNYTVGGTGFASIRIVYELAAQIVGFELSTVTSIIFPPRLATCEIEMADPQLKLACNFAWDQASARATITIASLVPSLIRPNMAIVVILPLNPTYGLISFGVNQPATLQVKVPIVANILPPPAPQWSLMEECSISNAIDLQVAALGSSFTLENLQFDVSNLYAATTLSFDFGVGSFREYIPAATTTLKFDLGFLTDPNSYQLICQIHNKQGGLSYLFDRIDNTVAGQLLVYLKRDLANPNQYRWTMNCVNAQTPGSTLQLQGFVASWIEQTGTSIVQQATPISYSDIASSVAPLNGPIVTKQVAPTLRSKILNSPGYGAIYTFDIQNGALRILYTYRIYVRLHVAVPPRLNRAGIVSCQINERSCYCEVKDRLVEIWPSLNVDAWANFTVTIGQVDQPAQWPLSAKIWLAIDTDDQLGNGVYFQSFITDIAPAADPVTPITLTLADMSGNFIRSEQTHSMHILLASGTMVSGNYLFVEFPPFYIEVLDQYTENTLYNVTEITCSLLRSDDVLAVNLADGCSVISGSVVQVALLSDSANNFETLYVLTLLNVPLPRKQVPADPLNAFRLRVHMTEHARSKVKFSTSVFSSDPLGLVAESQQELYWRGSEFAYDRSEKLALSSTRLGTEGIRVQQGVFTTVVELTPYDPQSDDASSFTSTFGFQFDPIYIRYFFATYPAQLVSSSGDTSSRFLLSAQSNLQPGSYQFPVSKQAGGSSYVNSLPYINFFVTNDQCRLATNAPTFEIPLGGISQPIIIDIASCFPQQDLRITVVPSIAGTLTNVLPNPQSIQYTPRQEVAVVGAMYFPTYQFIYILSHQTKVHTTHPRQASMAAVGDIVTLSFTLDGQNEANYIEPPPVTLTYTDPALLSKTLLVSFTQAPEAFRNTMRFYLTCSDKAYLYWVIGVDGDISFIPWMDLRNNTLYQNHDRTHRSASDTEWKIYGYRWVAVGLQPAVEYFDHLKQNSYYELKAYCVNQLGLVSDPFLYQWQTPSNGGRTLKATITTDQQLSSLLRSLLVCTMNKLFPVDPSRIFNHLSVECDVSIIKLINTGTTARMLQATDNSTTNLTEVQFYVPGCIIGEQPSLETFVYFYADESAQSDSLSSQVVSSLANVTGFVQQLSTAMNLDPEADPAIVNVTYEYPTLHETPDLNYTQPEVGTTSVRMNFTLKGVNGYVGVGIDQTDVAPNPTILQMRRQTNYINRPFMQSHLLFFNQVESNKTFGQTEVVVFYGLTPNLKYKVPSTSLQQIFWFASNDDAGPLQLTVPVNSTVVLTLPEKLVIYGQLIAAVSVLIILVA